MNALFYEFLTPILQFDTPINALYFDELLWHSSNA